MTPEQKAAYDLMMGIVEHDHEVRETYQRAPFGWPGGKDLSKKHILPRLPIRDTWLEACGGSGIITLNRARSNLDVFNDRDAGVTAFYRCLANRELREKLIERLGIHVHSREEFIWSRDTWRNCTDDVERAARWYYIIRFSFSQLGRNFARQTSGDAKNSLSNYIYSALPEFRAIGTRFAGVQVENLDLFQAIDDYDSHGSVIYVDPNYVGASKGIYENEIDDEKQHRLCKRIHTGHGFFALSGYPNPIYDNPKFDWDDRITWEVPVSSKAKAYTETNNKADLKYQDTSLTATEVLWLKDNTKRR